MRVLLDTHAFLWFVGEPSRLGAHRRLLEDPDNELLLSAASSWEISIKYALGRLDLPDPPETFVPQHLRLGGIVPVPVHHRDALRAGTLPMHHRDPFDRLLIAQAVELRVPVVTADDAFAFYGVDLLRI